MMFPFKKNSAHVILVLSTLNLVIIIKILHDKNISALSKSDGYSTQVAGNTVSSSKEPSFRYKKSKDPGHIDLKRRELLYENRKRDLLEACGKNGTRYTGYYTEEQVKKRLLYDQKHKFVYCTIEKVGSTFIKRVLQVLTGVTKEKNPYKIPTMKAHTGLIKTLKDLQFDEIYQILSESTKFIIVREPYSRLFSGYVSKFFFTNLLFWNAIGKYAIKLVRTKSITTGHKCGHDLTFAEFVKYFIHSVHTRTHRDGHFNPMFEHCRPCQIKYDIIAKMETFSNDSFYILDKLNAGKLKVELQNSNETRVDDEFDDKASWIFNSRHRTIGCMSFYDTQRRLWKKMQIQGFISKKAKYPFSREESKIIKKEDYIKALHDAIGDTKNKQVSATYRQEAMDEAYRSVDLNDMKKLREIFKPDCELFKYDCSPPRYFQRSLNTTSKLWYLDINTA